jgi:hypothetical protein
LVNRRYLESNGIVYAVRKSGTGWHIIVDGSGHGMQVAVGEPEADGGYPVVLYLSPTDARALAGALLEVAEMEEATTP